MHGMMAPVCIRGRIQTDNRIPEPNGGILDACQAIRPLSSPASVRHSRRAAPESFSTGAPLPGVPSPPPDRQAQAERILLGPLNTSDVAPTLRRAQSLRHGQPEEAAALFGEVAVRLSAEGFHGHALVLRRLQLDVLAEATLADMAIQLAGKLAIAALMRGERDDARSLTRLIATLNQNLDDSDGRASTRLRQIELLDAAIADMQRPMGSPDHLLLALKEEQGGADPGYRHTLVLYLAEDLFATEPSRLAELSRQIDGAIGALEAADPEGEELLSLRLVRAEYDADERRELLKAARRHLVTKRAAALISAREGRRCALEGRVE